MLTITGFSELNGFQLIFEGAKAVSCTRRLEKKKVVEEKIFFI